MRVNARLPSVVESATKIAWHTRSASIRLTIASFRGSP